MKHKLFKNRGFTLMELMTVVFIIGILAAVALPLLGRYLLKAKTTEATLNIRKIYDGEISYYQEEITTQAGLVISKRFVNLGRMPATPGTDKQYGNFTNAGWAAIKFSADGPVLYSYSSIAAGVNTAASFTARAEGDLDGDGTTSLFERVASVNAAGDVEGGGALYTLDELE